jgi:hypothetical protein
MDRVRYVVGVDLGKTHDPTAVAVLEHDYIVDPVYRVRDLYRYRLGTSYAEIAADLVDRYTRPPLDGRSMMAIDKTGVGDPIVETITADPRVRDVYAITISGGSEVGGSGHHLSVPKRDLINTTRVMLEQHRIRIAARLPDAAVLAKELEDFRVTFSDNGHPSYAPASSQGHDDLLLALSLALWTAENKRAPIPMRTYRARGRIPTGEDRFGPQLGF